MAFGDRLFGINGACGNIEGTGADIFIPLDCFPQWVEVFNTTTGAALFWNKDMPQDSGYLFAPGGAGVTGATSGGTPAGTVTAPTFSGTALAGHSHNLQAIIISGTYTAWIVYHGAVAGGPFVIGETVTDGSGNTAVVSAVGFGLLEFNAHGGPTAFQATAALTGGTSGATATATSGLLGTIVPGAPAPYILTSASFNNNAQPMVVVPQGFIPNTTPSARRNPSTSGFEGSTIDWDGNANDTYAFSYLAIAVTSVSAGTPAGTNSIPDFTGSALAAHTHTYAGGGGGGFISVGGISAGTSGFIIGTNTSLNILGDTLNWNIGRF